LTVFANATDQNDSGVTINVPIASTWDFNSVAASTPEPGSLGLIVSGLALLGAWKARGKQ
jgi:hypothetical protein